ncbi:MAG: DUF2513 domain-containing protein [Anaerolineales bacterium]|nr:DUF2513 domain-containing protein [Anaerolineales bacterium]
MKRDLDLVRKILFLVEDKPDIHRPINSKSFDLPDWSAAEINYHLLLLVEAGYLEGRAEPYESDANVFITRLTWPGHEFLEAARDDGRWKEAKSVVKSVGTFTFDILKAILIDLGNQAIRSSLGLPPV